MTARVARRLAAAVACTAFASMVHAAADVQDLAALRRIAETAARQGTADLPGRVVIDVPAMDSRVRLPACESLETFTPPGTRLWGRTQVGIRCQGPDSWSVLVPLQVQVFGPAVYSARPLVAGQPIGATDVVERDSDLTKLSAGVLSSVDDAIGKVPRLGVSAGQALRGDMLRGKAIVAAGQNVSIVYRSNGIVVRSEGRALHAAGLGESVQVRSASGKALKGTVTAPGEVEVR